MDDDSADKVLGRKASCRGARGCGGFGGGGGKGGYGALAAAALMMKGKWKYNLSVSSKPIQFKYYTGTLMAAGLGALALLAGKYKMGVWVVRKLK